MESAEPKTMARMVGFWAVVVLQLVGCSRATSTVSPAALAAKAERGADVAWTRGRQFEDAGEGDAAAKEFREAARLYALSDRGKREGVERRLLAVRKGYGLRRPEFVPELAFGCDLDAFGECKETAAGTTPTVPPPRAYGPGAAALVDALGDYVDRPELAATIERAPMLLELAQWQASHGHFETATETLGLILEQHPDHAIAPHAARLLLESWLYRAVAEDAPSEVRARAWRELSALTETMHERPAWRSGVLEGDRLRARMPFVQDVASWWRARQARQTGWPQECASELERLYARSVDRHPDPVAVLLQAATCAYEAGRLVDGIRMQNLLLDRHPEDAAQATVLLELADAYRKMLFTERARQTYAEFLERFPEHAHATDARQRHLSLTLMLGGSLDGPSLDANDEELQAAIAYRVIRTDDSEVEALESYLRRYRTHAGDLRAFLVHARAALAHFSQACPVEARGLCVELAVDGSLGVPLLRDEQRVRRGLEHMKKAVAILQDGKLDDPWAGFGPPLEIPKRELDRVAGDLLIMAGDNDAEHALRFLPPVSHDPQRSRAWLRRRSEEVAAMARAYEATRIGPIEMGPGHIALSSSRQAQVYESDAGLTAEVAASVGSVDPELHQSLRALSRTRGDQEREAYGRCLDALAAWGQDVQGTAAVCRRGLGRLLERYESPREMTGTPSPALLIGG